MPPADRSQILQFLAQILGRGGPVVTKGNADEKEVT